MPVSIVVGGQFGSEGKGEVALEMVRRDRNGCCGCTGGGHKFRAHCCQSRWKDVCMLAATRLLEQQSDGSVQSVCFLRAVTSIWTSSRARTETSRFLARKAP